MVISGQAGDEGPSAGAVEESIFGWLSMIVDDGCRGAGRSQRIDGKSGNGTGTAPESTSAQEKIFRSRKGGVKT